MKPNSRFQRAIATFFLLIFFPTLVPQNLYASNNGPVAPEAASFEPVDATDMVNLATGDMSYVLPLINVPSPEGGYPLALSYHAGIAMDQEASWVGLGWSLNPGAINRSVKGIPDDWFNKRTSEFFYDTGDTVDSYSFSIGGTFANGLTVGLGASWGSHQSFGGNVMLGYAGMTGSIGTDGSWSVGMGGLTVGTNGASLSIGVSANNSNFGLALQYDLVNNNLGLGLSANTGYGNVNFASVGISLSSNKVSFGTLTNSNDSQSSGVGKYDVKNSSERIGINLGLFWFGYGHQRVVYSMFSTNNFNEAGSIYPESYKIGAAQETLNLTHNNTLYGGLAYYFRTDTYNEAFHGSVLNLSNNSESYTTFVGLNAIFSNYDNYIVDAQGISGQMSPGTIGEQSVSKTKWFVNPNIDSSNVLGDKINFRFLNSNTSFLRTGNGDFMSYGAGGVVTPQAFNDIRNNLYTGNFSALQRSGNNYSQNITPSGELIKNGNKLREGNFIEVFTNEQIIQGGVSNFIEAKGINRSTDNEFQNEPKGIGAYRITTIDGKTYHYSLPVYQFDTHFKNFNNQQNENSRFYESTQDCKYATHWLLTAVTGPDYVDSNMNGQVDNNDYGYWVEFQYGKWSDGYVWRSPHDGYKNMPGINNYVDGTYSYYWGRKQIYYLDMIKTRTHSALFIKKSRDDNSSSVFSAYNSKITNPANFDRNNCVKVATQRNGLTFGKKGDLFYTGNGSPYIVTNLSIAGARSKYLYLEAPKNYSLALDKIMILKNENIASLDKQRGAMVPNSEGYYYEGYGYTSVLGINGIAMDPVVDLFSDNATNKLKCFKSNIHQNVLDVKDIEGLNFEEKSIKTIKFGYNYDLAKQTVTSFSQGKGRLTLDRIEFLDKNSKSSMPPYRFYYNDKNVNYNKSDEDDWGYHKTNPGVWSLSRIETPVGAAMDIEYESDSYRRQAVIDNDVYGGNIINRPLTYGMTARPQFGYSGNTLTSIVKSNGRIHLKTVSRYDPGDRIPEQYYKTKEVYVYYVKEIKSFYDVYEIEDVVVVDEGNFNRRVELVLKPTDETRFFNDFTDVFYPLNFNWQNITTDPNKRLADFTLIVPTDSYTSKDDGVSTTENYTPNGKLGGGIRVKSISLSEKGSTDIKSKESYSYINPYSNKISGITSYTPFDKNKTIPMLSFLPTPDVNYEYVTVSKSGSDGEIISKQIFEFNVIKPLHNKTADLNGSINGGYSISSYGKVLNYSTKSGGLARYTDQYNSDFSMSFRNIEVKRRFSLLGSLRALSVYNNKNQLIYKKKNFYKDDLDGDGQIGVKQSSTVGGTFAPYTNASGDNALVFNLSILEYPNLIERVDVIANSKISTTYYDKYDFLTGQVLETSNESSDGKKFKTRVVPAYTKYPQMGSKIDNPSNRNMLSQTAAEYSYIYDPADANKPWKETGVGITTWNNEWTYQDIEGNLNTPTLDKEKIWRKHKAYVWNGVKNSGIFQHFNSATDDGFDWTVGVGSQPTQWKQISEVTKYNRYSMMLEAKDINKNHSSTKMGDDDTKITAVGTAKYNELFYSGMENSKIGSQWLDPGIKSNGALRSTALAHTGAYSASATDATALSIYLKANQHKAGKYKLNVWVHKNNAQDARINYGGVTYNFNGETKQAGDWILKTHYLDLTVADTQVHLFSATSAAVVYDDVMLRPLASGVTGYVYNQWDELSHIVGNNGLATRFEYDAAGRLVKTYVEVFDDPVNVLTGGFKLTKENKQKYKYL